VVFPELLGGVFARNALEDFGSAGVFVCECWVGVLACLGGSGSGSSGWVYGGRRRSNLLVMSYTPSSTMIYMPEAASLWEATSVVLNDFDMICFGRVESCVCKCKCVCVCVCVVVTWYCCADPLMVCLFEVW